MITVLFLQPPSPPGMEVTRDYAGGFGIAVPSQRSGYGHWQWSIPCVSLMYSAGILARQGYDVAYVDAQAERLSGEATIERVCKIKPMIIVAVVNLPSIRGDAELLKQLRTKCSDSKLICIGSVCKVLPDELAKMNFADFLVLGEAESVLPDLVRNIAHDGGIEKVKGLSIVNNGEPHRTRPSTEMADLASLPWPPYEIMPTTSYYDVIFGAKTNCLPIWASRGCRMPCSFYCPYPTGLGNKIRVRPTRDVVKEIVYLNRRFGISAFIFRDQVFSANRRRAEEMCDLLIGEKLKIQWVCETRFDTVNERLLKKMKRAGCRRVHFGLETGDPELLYETGKPGMKLSTVKETIRIAKKVGIPPMTHIILGLPGETPQTVKNTIATLREIGITNVNVNIATPYPGTPLFKVASEKGLLETKDWTQYSSYKSVMRTESLSTAELERLRDSLPGDLLGTTIGQRWLYLCKSREIIDYSSTLLQRLIQNPSLSLEFMRSYISTGSLRETERRLKESLNSPSKK